jgi:VanZ family protein
MFLLFLGLWTWKLLEPSPVPERVAGEIPTDLKFVLAKMAHAGAYAVLTVLAAWLPVRRPYFWAVVAVLALHGVATEMLQHAMALGRTGKVADVLIDWAGIGLGLLALRRFGSTVRR